MKVLGIIPARFNSSRFPGKPLIDINGRSMIMRVYDTCVATKILDKVIVATDDTRILNHIQECGGEVMMTSTEHENGTERVAEIASHFNDYDIVINIQGDEPCIFSEQIEELVFFMKNHLHYKIATLVHEIDFLKNPSITEIENAVKVYFSDKNKATFFYRQDSIAQYLSFPEKERTYHGKHIGIYGFHRKTLLELVQLKPTENELLYRLEQLRWMDNNYDIGITWTEYESPSVDIPSDVEKVKLFLEDKK